MAERKFSTLRKRLDQLGYRQPLGIESLPLVEKLFSDLVHTTESLKNLKQQISRHDKEKTSYEDNIEPYRSDNAKLVKENNELHLQHIKLREETDQTIKDLKASLRKLEHENADLKFLNTQYVHKVKALEKDAKVKTERIQSLQEKNLHAVVETPGGRRKQIPFRRQRMDIDRTVSPAREISSADSVQDPYVADLLSVADTRIEELQSQTSRLQDDREAAERRNKSLRKQIEARDKEIERLNQLLQGGRPIDAVLKDSRKDSGDRVVAHLNVQVDYLQQANRDLEKRLKDALNEQIDARRRANDFEEKNLELLSELKDIDRMSKKVEESKERDVNMVKRDLVDARGDIKVLTKQMDDSRTELMECRRERQQLMEDNERLAARVENAERDVKHVTDLLDKSDKDRRRLSEKNAQLTITERELVMDLERLKLSKSVKPKKGHGKSPSKLETLVKTLEKERDYYKGECDALQDMMRKRLTHPTGSPTVKRKSKGKGKGHAESMLQLMEEERDFYKKECELLRHSKEKGTLRASPIGDRNSGTSPGEMKRLRRERDELQALVEKFEKHLQEIQSNVKTLTQDRDNVQLLYEQATEEIQRLRRQLVRARSPSPSRAASAVLSRVEIERDTAVSDLRRANTQIDVLEEKVKVMQESQDQERRRYEEKIRNLELLLEKVEDDRNELHARVSSLRGMVSGLEDQIKQTSAQLSATKDTALEKESEVNKVRIMADHAERTADDLQRKLNSRAGELQAVEEKAFNLESRVEELESRNLAQREEIAQLRGTLKSLDRERDELEKQVDEKTEDVVSLEANRIQLEKAENELKINMEELEARLSHSVDQTSLKDREVKSLRRQLDSRDEELAEMTRGREMALRENRRLQSDLGTMTEENQSIHQQLQDSLEEQETLKTQITEYARQVARVEELLAEKDREKEDLLEQYKALSSEAEKWMGDAKTSAGQASSYRMELAQKDQAQRDMREKIQQLEDEIEQHEASAQAYEMQLSSLTRSLSQMEEQLRQANEDRESLIQDLAAVRELCTKLDQTRESLSRQLAAKSLDQEQLRELLEDANSETDNLRRQVFDERENIRNLETVITKNREKEYLERKSMEETIDEVDRLRDKLSRTEAERSFEREEVKTLRKASERLEGEVNQMRKQLIAEKYERERLLHDTSRPGSRDTHSTRYSRNGDPRGLHTSFSSGEFARLRPKDRSSPLLSSDGGIISPIHRHSEDDFSDAS